MTPLQLSGPLTRDQAPSVLQTLRQALQEQLAQATGPDPLVVHLQGLNEVDTSALAVLLDLQRMAAARGRSLRFAQTPSALLALARLSSVETLLDFQ